MEKLLITSVFKKTCIQDTIAQTFCFANWVQNKGSLSMLCIAPEAFIRRNTIDSYPKESDCDGPFAGFISLSVSLGPSFCKYMYVYKETKGVKTPHYF